MRHNLFYDRYPPDGGRCPSGRPPGSEILRMGQGDKVDIGVLLVRNETPLFMDTMVKALASEPSVHLPSPPLTEDAAAAFCARNRPDVVLIEATEASAASLQGFVRSIVAACDPAPVILVADARIDDSFLVAGLQAGAFGIVDGIGEIEDVLRVIHEAANGTKVVDTHRFLSAAPVAAQQREEERHLLERKRLSTDREREVPQLLGEGLNTEEVAERLSISPRTVEKHVQHIIRKLEVDSRLQAVVMAARMEGLASEPLGEPP